MNTLEVTESAQFLWAQFSLQPLSAGRWDWPGVTQKPSHRYSNYTAHGSSVTFHLLSGLTSTTVDLIQSLASKHRRQSCGKTDQLWTQKSSHRYSNYTAHGSLVTLHLLSGLWSHFQNSGARTTNLATGFHNSLNARFGTPHLSMRTFPDSLQKCQFEILCRQMELATDRISKQRVWKMIPTLHTQNCANIRQLFAYSLTQLYDKGEIDNSLLT